MSNLTTTQLVTSIKNELKAKAAKKADLESGAIVPALAYNLEAWADQKAIATPDTYTDAVRTTGGDIPIETSAGSKPESIKPVAGSKWTAKLLFNGSYNMLNAAKWGAANSQPYVGGVGNDFVYFLVPELTLGTFGTADENNGLLFTDSDGENVQPSSVYFKPLGATVPQSLTDGTSITPTSVSYDGNTYKDYATDGAGWLIVPKTIYDNDVCAHIAWEDWYDKYVSLDEPTTNPEAVVGVLMLEGLLALAHSDKYLRGVNEEVCDNVVFGETSATISHMVDELSVAANAWTNAATGESDSQGNALYRHSATVSGIKQGGAACVEGEDGGIPLTVNGTTVSYVDTNAAAPASVVFYQIPTTAVVEKAYTDNVFSGSNIDVETGILPINDCSIEAQVAMDGKANITVKYAKNIVDQVAINATVDVPQIKKQVEEHEERIEELEDTAVRTGSYDASVSVGLTDNLRGDTIVNAEFYKRKTGGTQSVGSGIAAIKEVRGKSFVWNQLVQNGNFESTSGWSSFGGTISVANNVLTLTCNEGSNSALLERGIGLIGLHKIYCSFEVFSTYDNAVRFGYGGSFPGTTVKYVSGGVWTKVTQVLTTSSNGAPNLNLYSNLNNCANSTHPTQFKNVYCIDLTLMFGAGNEPSSVEEFEKMFPLDYYDYNAGEVIPFAAQNLVTVGFNQWDEQWEVGGYYRTTGEKRDDLTHRIRSKNHIPVMPGQTYYIKAPSDITVLMYDLNGSLLSTMDTYNNTITIGQNVRSITIYTANDVYGSTYNHDICINISDPDKNGTYEPYEKHTLPLDPSQWRDKQGNLVFPYGGMHGVGTAYDYAKVNADGYIRKATPVYGEINVGDYDYTKQGNLYTTNGFVPPKANMLFGRGKSIVWNQLVKSLNQSSSTQGITRTKNGNALHYSGTATKTDNYTGCLINVSNVKSSDKIYYKIRTVPNTRYIRSNISQASIVGATLVLNIEAGETVDFDCYFTWFDLTLMFGAGNEPATAEEFEAMFPLDYYAYDEGSLGILANQTYADAAAFKAAMQGVPLIYELAEPVEVELATPIYAKYLVDKDGTEEITPANGAAPYTAPANLSILYAMDARGTIANLPKNYLSKESAENMLNAMVTAGVIASYTMTYDAANGRYAFTFVKAEQTNQVNNESNI